MTAALEWVDAPPPTGAEIVAAGRRAPTARQQKVLDFMRSYAAAHGYPPTLREIGAHMGIRSTNGVNDHLRALERKGLIRRRDGLSRGAVAINGTPSADSFAQAIEGWRAENEALRALLGKVQAAAPRLPRLTAEFVVLLGDVRDALGAKESAK
jgi:SOS-response transcriptional repressor LexA